MKKKKDRRRASIVQMEKLWACLTAAWIEQMSNEHGHSVKDMRTFPAFSIPFFLSNFRLQSSVTHHNPIIYCRKLDNLPTCHLPNNSCHVCFSGGTLLWDNCRLIGRSLIVLAWKVILIGYTRNAFETIHFLQIPCFQYRQFLSSIALALAI